VTRESWPYAGRRDRQSRLTDRRPGIIYAAWRNGWQRVLSSPAIVAGVLAMTLVLALPLALTMRGLLQEHLGGSLMAHEAADAVNYDWWQEFTSQTAGLGATFSPTIIGFASTLDAISGLMDRQSRIVPVAAAIAMYLAGWTFLVGGILDRYSRQRPTRARGFFAACGIYVVRFVRLALAAGVVYWWLFTYVHPWLFADLYPAVTRSVSVERTAFVWRLVFYAIFGTVLLSVNVLFDYAKIRTVVEDRRSMIAALAAALRFIARCPGRVTGLYVLNSTMLLAVIAIWALVAPGARGAGLSMWLTLAAGQVYLLARLVLKLHFLASQTALFQASLAHARYTAAPEPVWPESPAVETVRPAP
jgi:hypothetical protein